MTTTDKPQPDVRAHVSPVPRQDPMEPGAPKPDADGYRAVRELTEVLAAPLGPEDQVVQSMPDASPTKWHRAHTTWFFEEFVLSSVDGQRCFDPDFRYLFNSYYEAVGPRQPRPRRGMITRPDVHEVSRYRQFVDRAMAEAFTAGTFDERTISRIELGLHHEQQHQELLLMDALHLLAQNPLQPAYDDGLPPTRAGAPGSDGSSTVARPRNAGAGSTAGGTPGAGLLERDGGLLEFGHDGAGGSAAAGYSTEASFSYDNEGPRHRQWLETFAIDDRLVTCGEWIEFMEDGGYERADLWLSNGWALLNEHDWQAPAYWTRADDGWHHFTLAGLSPVDPVVPVAHVSYHEADAFARWRGARLPTEFEWEAVARDHWQPARRGTCPPLHPQAARSAGADPHQFTGELWQWTSSAYLPYPGFSPTAGAIGEYNGKFMVDQHVLRGSSALTPPGHERVTYRNFFPPASRWAATGVRLAHDC